MDFTTGKTYRFVSRRGWKTRVVESTNKPKKLEYLRRVGKIDLFRHPTAGWLEGFTLRQAEDYEITEVRA